MRFEPGWCTRCQRDWSDVGMLTNPSSYTERTPATVYRARDEVATIYVTPHRPECPVYLEAKGGVAV